MVDELVLDIVGALQWVTSELELELFPALRKLSLGNSPHFIAAPEATEAIAPFFNTRKLSALRVSIIVYNWDTSSFRLTNLMSRTSQGSRNIVGAAALH